MPPFLRLPLWLAAIATTAFFLVQPYNSFCQTTDSCRPFYFSYYIPKTEGTEAFSVIFEAESSRPDIEFYSDESSIITYGNKKNLVTYRVKNLSDKTITVRPKLMIDELTKILLKRYECPCLVEHKIKPNETKVLRMEFEISKKIEEGNLLKEINGVIRIHYKI